MMIKYAGPILRIQVWQDGFNICCNEIEVLFLTIV